MTLNGERIFPALLKGITSHIVLRWPSWLMCAVMIGFGTILVLNPHIFRADSRAFQYLYLYSFFNQLTWAALCIGTGLIRASALFVNGTFPAFPWSPHIRALCSALSCFVWLNMSMGVCMGTVWSTAIPTYIGYLIFDTVLTITAVSET